MTAERLKTKAEQGYAAQFSELESRSSSQDWVQRLREDAMSEFNAIGLPHRRVEEWKYTDLRARIGEVYGPAGDAAALSGEKLATLLGPLGDIDAVRLVLVNGVLDEALSDLAALSGSCEILPLHKAVDDAPDWVRGMLTTVNPPRPADATVALNQAFLANGVALRTRMAAPGRLEKPIMIVHVTGGESERPTSAMTRNLLAIGDGVEATVVEAHVQLGTMPSQVNAVTETMLGERASLQHIKAQTEGAETTHLSTWMTRLGAQASYRAFQFSTGGALSRNQIFVAFAGEGASSHLNGAVMARGGQHNDTTMVVDHAVPGCESREFYKLVLDDAARGIVQCKVNVHRDAQKSDGHQAAHAMLLSEAAEFDSKPELEIFADDVVCGHGSTSGQVDEEFLFYLRSRGIPEPQARALLISAFTGEAIAKVDDEAVRGAFQTMAEAWLADEGA